MTELFEVVDFDARTTVLDFIARQNEDLWLFGYYGAGFILQLTNQPDSTMDQSLNFKLEFSDGKVLNAEVDRFFVEGK